MFENPRRGRQARNFTTNVSKILDLKSSSEQMFSWKLSLGAPDRSGSNTANTSKKPVGLGLTDLWKISLQNRSSRWPQFCFPRPQNKLARSTHTSKVTSTFILALFKPVSTSGIISTHSLIGNLLQNPLAFSSPHTARKRQVTHSNHVTNNVSTTNQRLAYSH